MFSASLPLHDADNQFVGTLEISAQAGGLRFAPLVTGDGSVVISRDQLLAFLTVADAAQAAPPTVQPLPPGEEPPADPVLTPES